MDSSFNNPEISVLVPVYNVEKYLGACLRSLVNQSFGDFEVICINDGSTDSSRSIIQEYVDADSRFRVIDKANSGYGVSMNMGLRQARGRYVAILESDDLFEVDALKLLHEEALRHGADVVKANFWLYWSVPEEKKALFRVVDSKETAAPFAPLDDLAIFFRKPSIWSALYKREFLIGAGIHFLETPGASYQDAGFNFKVWASASSVSCLEAPVLFYRQDNESSSVNSESKVFCVCDEYEAMASFVDEHFVGEKRRALKSILERMKLDSYLWNYDRLAGDLRRDFLEHVKGEFSQDLIREDFGFDCFEPGAKADFIALAGNQSAFVTAHDGRGTIGRYLALGGLPLLLRGLTFKVFGQSIRRTNEEGASL